MKESLADSVVRRLQPAPFWDHVGAALVEVETGRAVICLPKRAEFGRSGQADGPAHGGIVATAIDMAASCATITVLSEEEGRATIDLAVHYLAPSEGDLTASATVRRRGGRTAFVDVEVHCAGRLTALGRVTFAITSARRAAQKERGPG